MDRLGSIRSPNQQIGHGLMKQKSRRLLDAAIRRRMLMDTMKGYDDELQYNYARRSTNYDQREHSSAIDGLKDMQKWLFSTNAPASDGLMIFQNRGTFRNPVSNQTAVSPDCNANCVSTSIVTNAGTSKPPLLIFSPISVGPSTQPTKGLCSNDPPPVHAKSSARSAISNALSQSMNFKIFKQGTGPSIDSNDVGMKWNYPNARTLPINFEKKEESVGKSAEKQNSKSKKCTSSAFISMPNSDIAEQPLNRKNPDTPSCLQPPINLERLGTASTRHVNDLKNGKAMLHKENANFVNTPPAANDATTSKFRAERVTGEENPEQKISDNTLGRNYISGVKLYKPSPSKHASMNFNLPELSKHNVEVECKKMQAHDLTNETPMPTSAEKLTENEADFTKGITFSTKKHQPTTSNSSFQNSTKANPSQPRQTNKSATPQDGAMCKTATATSKTNIHQLRGGGFKVKLGRCIIMKLVIYDMEARFDIKSDVNEDWEKKEKTKEGITLPRIQIEEKKEHIPQFYFPKGKPRPKDEIELAIQRISDVCGCFENRTVPVEEMGLVAKACNLSLYWKGPLFYTAVEAPEATEVSEEALVNMWKSIATTNHDAPSRFVALLAKAGKNRLEFEDFLPLLKDIVGSHPGLIFLKDAPEFHTRYMNTVIARIFYVINRSWSGQITPAELRKSNFLTVLSRLEEENDINTITDYFSYEHFYVIYCKFWELDSDHDLVIDKHDLLGYGDGVLSSSLIDRVLSGAVTRWDRSNHQLGRMSYVDFVWFILSEEDKKTPTSIEYWFRCMDLDGDGCISMYEMKQFYEGQSQKLEELDIEPLPFEDCVCQIFDIINPKSPGKVSLNDLKKSNMAHVFFDTFFNVAKYLNNEQKDPFIAQNTANETFTVMSDWDNFAAEEYEMLVAEEQSNKQTIDLSKAYFDDDDLIAILEEQTREDSDSSVSAELKPGKRENEIAAEFTALNFIDTTKTETRVPLAQT